MDIQYIGEHLFIGKLGNFFIVLSFVAALFSSFAYFQAAKDNELTNSWKKLARGGFLVHSASVFGIAGTLFYMLLNHYFEYQYVWQHSNSSMPLKYILSCFWEGQEGSFLLWIFWHVILGLVLMRSSKSWELPVMTVFSSVQVFLTSMLLGIVIFDYRLGSNPFLLLREHPEFMDLPFTKVPNYLENLDGRGLNPLLQNYWMVIHPPMLFLGFASTLVPFCFAIAGLWKQKFGEWVKPALSWTFFGIGVFGVGILMGGAWAYEALSFGGFWAWDPVENASLVPWLTMVGAGHVMLVYKTNNRSLTTVLFLTIITFILVLYSTFLTRSGVLGESSVHAFTGLGMSGQLLAYLLFYLFLGIGLIMYNRSKIKSVGVEETSNSREFWMFIGALILLVSSFQIMFTTSIPVINKVLGTNLAPPLNPVQHYNSWQMPIAIIVALLIAIAQYFNYRKTDMKKFYKKMSVSFFVAIALTIIGTYIFNFKNYFYIALLFTSTFSITANIDYLIRVIKGNIYKGGASIAHIGFGMLLLGALISTGTSQTISVNTSGTDISKLGDSFNNAENIMMVKGDTLRMGPYFVTYSGKQKRGINIFYKVEYFTKNTDNTYTPEFVLEPLIQLNERMGNSAEPDTRHFLHKDIYTHITYADLENVNEENSSEYLKEKSSNIAVGDTLFANNSILIFEGLVKEIDKEKYELTESDLAIGALFKTYNFEMKSSKIMPIFVLRGNQIQSIDATDDLLGIKLSFARLNPETGRIDVELRERKENKRDFIIMKAIIFPGINILWAGCIIMAIGSILAVIQRVKSQRK